MDKTYLCVNCEKEFKAGAWYNCQGNPSRKHVVENRTFYSAHDKEVVNAVPQTAFLGASGERVSVPGIIVTFEGGQYHTTDPELQEVLSRTNPMPKDVYIEMRMTPELKSGRDRKVISDQQELINKLKEENEQLKKSSPPPATDGKPQRGRQAAA